MDNSPHPRRLLSALLTLAALTLILGAAAYLRLAYADWGRLTHQHPDETFLVGVTNKVTFQEGLENYFDPTLSPLNPARDTNIFFVYGTLPVYIVRLIADQMPEGTSMQLLGRQVSALFDLGIVLLVFVVAARLYGTRVGLLAAAFSALTVIQIQHAHFFVVDNFASFFMTLAFLAAVLISRSQRSLSAFFYTLLFGLAAGMAAASKVNAAVVLALLPAALLLRGWQGWRDSGKAAGHKFPWIGMLVLALLGIVLAFFTFRVLHPYAFAGPGFWGLSLDKNWLDDMRQQLDYSRGTTLSPWLIQWSHLSRWHSFSNMTVWGMGLPLGILVWVAALGMLWRSLRGEWRQHALLLGWFLLHFVWQATQATPFMRYQIPTYPLAAMIAAWGVFSLANARIQWRGRPLSLRGLGIAAGALALGGTVIWALAFFNTYRQTEPRIAASEWMLANVKPAIQLEIISAESGSFAQGVKYENSSEIAPGKTFETQVSVAQSTQLEAITFGRILPNRDFDSLGLSIWISTDPEPTRDENAKTATVIVTPDQLSGPVRVAFDEPVQLEPKLLYFIAIRSSQPITLRGERYANETSWDFKLPFGIVKSGTKGYLEPEVDMDVYRPDSNEKLEKLLTSLDQTDYIFLPTNHQYGQLSRVPERYPLMNLYYRELLGCPQGEDLTACYARAEPGDDRGALGFELVATFTAYPQLGPLVFNDQLAEESFTFYDHPKVMIFRKTADYDAEQVTRLLSAVDLTTAVQLTPSETNHYKSTLLTPAQIARQRAAGTWAQLFDPAAPQNQYPLLAGVLWYVFIALLGLGTYPLARIVFSGLSDRGYPFSRILGMLVLAWLAWISGSVGLGYSRLLIALLLVALLGVSGWVAYRQRRVLRAEFAARKRYILLIEALFLSLFLIDLWIRIHNPDLWHQSRGGERSMDFAYLNAVLKSVSFPPYDPWFAGGYINYYYFGFVLVGTPIKLLGITPSVAYNLALPTLFAMAGMGAFSVAWNLTGGKSSKRLLAGLLAAAGMVLLGNLETVRMIWNALNSNGGDVLGGIIRPELIQQSIRNADWYWEPSRAISAPQSEVTPITEFPLFTFLYGDLHAHMMALPLALGALGWALSAVRGKHFARPRRLLLSIPAGALLIGSLLATNTWDLPLYLLMGCAALALGAWRRSPVELGVAWRLFLSGAAAAVFAFITLLLFRPYSQSYFQTYGSVRLWDQSTTELPDYLVHWGFFLFMIVSWMAVETIGHWKKGTGRFKSIPYASDISIVLFVVGLLSVYYGAPVGWVITPLVLWAGILFIAFPLKLEKRIALVLFAGCLLLTLVVEFIVLAGDVGRMNTVFKFYLQVWTLFAVLAGASIGWISESLPRWPLVPRYTWGTAAALLLAGAAVYLFTGSSAKMDDRMEPVGPVGLDGMAFMTTGIYRDYDKQTDIPLNADYRAIRWVQQNIPGTPVIVEMHTREYKLGSRYTMYTGLPGVVGWNAHQRQQRAKMSDGVEKRSEQVRAFYDTTDIDEARAFLDRYNVEYIVVGRLERSQAAPEGLTKFEQFEGVYWEAVYTDGDTVIYHIRP